MKESFTRKIDFSRRSNLVSSKRFLTNYIPLQGKGKLYHDWEFLIIYFEKLRDLFYSILHPISFCIFE
jgi:hypothetical protein